MIARTAGKTGSVDARSMTLLLSRLVGERLADTPYGKHFLASEP
jgi:hypothetical protein